MRSLLLVAALQIMGTAASFNVTLLVTRGVRGAVYMVDKKKGLECPPLSIHPCKCLGGAARRRTILEQARNDRIALETRRDTASRSASRRAPPEQVDRTPRASPGATPAAPAR